MPDSSVFSACTAQRNDGTFCDAPSLPNAPFPICVSHAAKVLTFLRNSVYDVTNGDTSTESIASYLRMDGSKPRVKKLPPAQNVVYYVSVQDWIKIGTTTCLEYRIRAYPPESKILAVEPGDAKVERQRHDEFNEYIVAGREWFSRGERLMQHIERLQANKVSAKPGLRPWLQTPIKGVESVWSTEGD